MAVSEKLDVQEFLSEVSRDQLISEDIRKKAATISLKLSEPAYRNDRWIYRAVVLVLGLVVTATVLGGLGLAALGNASSYKIPPEIVAIGSAAVGALAGLLAPSPREKD
jgi:hypothetical protein